MKVIAQAARVQGQFQPFSVMVTFESQKEMDALVGLLGCISGCPETSNRQFTQPILNAIQAKADELGNPVRYNSMTRMFQPFTIQPN